MTEKSARDPELTRNRILAAAFELFVDKGVGRVTLREIAEQSGVTKSLIHHHFGSKEALWSAVKEQAFVHYYTGQKAELTSAENSDPALLMNGVVRYFQFLRGNPQVVRLFAWAHLEGDTECSDMDGELVALGAEHVRKAQQHGLLREDINPTHVVAIFINTCTHWFQAREYHAHWPGIGSDEAFLDDFLKVFMEGLLPRSD